MPILPGSTSSPATWLRIPPCTAKCSKAHIVDEFLATHCPESLELKALLSPQAVQGPQASFLRQFPGPKCFSCSPGLLSSMKITAKTVASSRGLCGSHVVIEFTQILVSTPHLEGGTRQMVVA